ncbi:MAG: hypothetical protein N4A45_10055 [Flavobacteriales bacterium]|jgi:DNA repair protein RecN (Recombination protein N)|nr:hypothetical protein [Flavobacteriales bacterium]
MLQSFKITNFALIEHQLVDFAQTLNIFSGQTGSGKSMMLDALAIVLGARWQPKLFFNPEKKCILEAHFFIKSKGLAKLFQKNDLDYDDELIIRREALPSGKNRIFVNDTPTTISVLKKISEYLISLHGQHDNTALANPVFQLEMLDIFIKKNTQVAFEKLLKDYQKVFHLWKEKQKEFEAFEEKIQEQERDRSYNEFLWNELENTALAEWEEDSLEERIRLLENSEKIQQTVLSIQQAREDESGALSKIQNWTDDFLQLKDISPIFEEWSERLQSVSVELTDLLYEINNYQFETPENSQELDELHSLSYQIDQLKIKHQVQTIEELRTKKNALKSQFSSEIENQERLKEIGIEVSELYQEANVIANQLHSARVNHLEQLQEMIESNLSDLAMPNAQIRFQLSQTEQLKSVGNTNCELLFSANKGFDLQKITHAASGGEFARLSLVLQSVLTGNQGDKTIVLDEIDTGVSGEVAHKMGLLMQKMAQKNQVICISHLAQVVSKGERHFKVAKDELADKTKVDIQLLNDQERILELATLLSGENIMESSLASAKQMLAGKM